MIFQPPQASSTCQVLVHMIDIVAAQNVASSTSGDDAPLRLLLPLLPPVLLPL